MCWAVGGIAVIWMGRLITLIAPPSILRGRQVVTHLQQIRITITIEHLHSDGCASVSVCVHMTVGVFVRLSSPDSEGGYMRSGVDNVEMPSDRLLLLEVWSLRALERYRGPM